MDTPTIEHIERLARLVSVKDETEKAEFIQKMGTVLAYIDTVLGQAATEKSAVVFTHTNITRPDIATEPDPAFRSQFLANAPATEDGFLKVTKIL